MSTMTTISSAAITAMMVLSAVACDDDNGGVGSSPTNGIVYGAALQVGNGNARSYIEYQNSKPTSFGVALSETALQGLPGGAGHAMGQSFVIPLPAHNATAFKLIALDWNPSGHEPPGTYDLPHFDFHFYTITKAERDAILPADPQFQAKAAKFPAATFIPAGYIAPAPAAVPQMGVHWIDPTSPEFTGQPFSRTFLFGSWDGKVIFAEPMITKAYLETRPNATFALPQAQNYSEPGWYPTSYTVRWDASSKQYLVALTGLTQKH